MRRLAIAVVTATIAWLLPGALAQPRPVQIADLFALREIGGLISVHLVPSPDGTRIAVFERNTDVALNRYHYLLATIDLATGERRQLADAGDIILSSTGGLRSGGPVDRRPAWSPDGAWIYYTSLQNGAVELWRASADGAGAEKVVRADGDIRRFAIVEEGGALIYETSTPRNDLAAAREQRHRHGFRVDDNFLALEGMSPPPDEEIGAAFFHFSLTSRETRHANPDERALLPPTRTARSALVRPINANDRVARPALGLFSSVSGSDGRCEAAACNGALDDAWIASTAGEPLSIVVLRREGFSRTLTALYEWRPGEANARLIRRVEDRLTGCILHGGALLCLQDTTLQPRRLVHIDLLSGAERVVYDPNPQWRDFMMPRVERIEYVDAEGKESYAHVVYPIGYRRGRFYPAIVVQYRSRGFLNAGTGGETPILPLSAAGYVVLSVDRPEFFDRQARMSLDQLQREIELDGSEAGSKREALLHFLTHLERQGLVDPSRMGIAGLSDGAETVFDMLLNAPVFAAAVVSSPPGDQMSWSFQSRQFRRDRFQRYAMTPPWDQTSPQWFEWWQRTGAAERGEEIRTPLLLNLADTEALRAFPLLARTERTGNPTEAWIYPGAFHLKWAPAQINSVQTRTLDWFNFWLRERSPASPDDPGRNQRWREMREAGATPSTSSR